MSKNELTETKKVSSKRLLNVEDIKLMKLRIGFDIQTLNMMIAFLTKDSVLRTRKTVGNIKKLIENTDPDMYQGNLDLSVRVWAIEKILKCIMEEKIENDEIIFVYCKDNAEDEYQKEFVETMKSYKITYNESKYLIKKIDSTLEFGYIATVRDVMMQILEQIDTSDYMTYAAISEDINKIAATVINIKRRCRSLDADQTFSLEQEMFEQVVGESVAKLRDRNRIFVTGIRMLNLLLSPGYLSKRLYMYLAFPGKGKSTMLLKAALDIRKYNTGIKTKNPEKRPAVLFITLENDIPETVERMFNMMVSSEDIRNYTPNQVIRSMQESGGLKLTEKSPIDIVIKEYKNREIDTEDLYSIIKDLSDDGKEVIALILDYVKRIRPAERADSEKEELKNITNELKELAKFFDIPVITAQQLNRTGAAVIDAAMQGTKEDITKLVGRDAIAGAWEIIENSDWVCVINPHVKRDTKELYMVFNRLKIRYRGTGDMDEDLNRTPYFNQPFEIGNDIRLVDDIYMDEPVGLRSLDTPFVPLETDKNQSRGYTNATTREVVKVKDTKSSTFSLFDEFDIDQDDYTDKKKSKTFKDL